MDYTEPKFECFWPLCHSKHLLSLVFSSFRPNVLQTGSVSVSIRSETFLPLDRSPLEKPVSIPDHLSIMCYSSDLTQEASDCSICVLTVLRNIWKWVASCFFQPLHLQSKICLYSLNKRLHWLQSPSLFRHSLESKKEHLIRRSHLFACLSEFDLGSAFKLLKWIFL
jgi:hypothetical protein